MGKLRLKSPTSRRKKLEQDLEHITQEMYRRNLELATSNKTLSLLRTIDSLVLESQDSLNVLCQQICQAITTNYDYPFVAIFSKETHSDHLPLMGWSANGKTELIDRTSIKNVYLDTATYTWYSNPKATNLYIISELSSTRLTKQLHSNEDTIESVIKTLGLQSACMIKLIARQHLVGVMVVGFAHHIDTLPADEKDFLERLGGAVGVAVDNKLLFEENRLIVGQLKKTNEKLRQLDKTKDDFISMASHQLRTPLTSVKGYLSMTLEGDGGPVNQKQKKLLSQAFISSQRMVYLIADMLNVSRLKTGKFVIEPEPTDLADAVQTEIDQLQGTAEARGLKLTYSKPRGFPMLSMDQTKIRQVIMNFVDNAIYYTPTGGHIAVALKEAGQSIEFTVTDDGIGVPKHEQPHLFTKFYRANNAKKARPDGTGLGLYMAKKVIIAQGGSLIFHSQEGKGSTFGFTIAKAKLQPKPSTPGPGSVETTT